MKLETTYENIIKVFDEKFKEATKEDINASTYKILDFDKIANRFDLYGEELINIIDTWSDDTERLKLQQKVDRVRYIQNKSMIYDKDLPANVRDTATRKLGLVEDGNNRTIKFNIIEYKNLSVEEYELKIKQLQSEITILNEKLKKQ